MGDEHLPDHLYVALYQEGMLDEQQQVEPEKLPFGVKPHDALVLRADRWLRSQGCGVVIRDPFRSIEHEQPDAIGWRSGVSILVECKVSRSDFLADKNKAFRKKPEQGMGNWRFYLCPPNVITPEDLPEGWGLLWAKERQIKKVCGCPPNTQWYRAPFRANQGAEIAMMYSALRRMEIRGHLHEIYDGVLGGPPERTDQQGLEL